MTATYQCHRCGSDVPVGSDCCPARPAPNAGAREFEEGGRSYLWAAIVALGVVRTVALLLGF